MNISFVFAFLATQAPVLRLEDAVRVALEKHPSLTQVQANREVAEAAVDGARAPLLPQVTGRASVQRTEMFADDPVSQARSGTTYGLGVSVDQLLWDFGQSSGRWRAAQATSRAETRSAEVTRRAVVLEVEVAWFAARAQRSLVEVARETLANQQRHFEQVEAFIEAGTRPEIDRAQARTDVANARVRFIRAENDAAAGMARLRQAMGVTDGADFTLADEERPPVAGEDSAVDLLVDEAVGKRPEMSVVTARREGLEATASAASGGYWPALSASLGLTDSGPAPDEMQAGWNGALTLTWRIFEGLQTRSEVAQAEARVRTLDGEGERLAQQIRFEVEEARLRVRSTLAEGVAAQEALAAARERLRLAEGRYETGVGNIIELGDAQLAVADAAAQEVRSRFDLASARARLEYVLGRD